LNLTCDLQIIDFSIENGKTWYKKDVFESCDSDLNTLHIHIQSKWYKFLYYSFWFQFFTLKLALKKNGINPKDFDLFVSNVLFPSGILSWMLAKKYKKKLYHLEHWSGIKKFLNSDFHKRKGRKALKYMTKIGVVSEILKKELTTEQLDSKISIVPNVVRSNFSYLKKEKAENTYRFLAIANWRRPKNPFLFLDALKVITENNPDKIFEVELIGEGEQLQEIKSRNYPFQITYVGNVPNAELTNHFQQADFFLHGSDFETFSVVTIEALLTGTPVIGSPVGVIPEVINDANGIVCENSTKSWSKGIEDAINTEFNHFEIAENSKDIYSEERITAILKSFIEE